MGDFLIPANSKKSLLIFGVFTPSDLILVGIGMMVTLIMLLTLPIENLGFAITAVSPALVCSFLVFPIPNYHNMITILRNIYIFYTNNQKFVWKGWCFNGESKK